MADFQEAKRIKNEIFENLKKAKVEARRLRKECNEQVNE